MVKKNYKVFWQDEAKSSLRRIYNFVKKQESKEQAEKVTTKLKKEGDNLGFIPHKYAKDPHLEQRHRDIRFKVIWSYKLVYEITKESVIILEVIHASRNPENLKLVR